MINNSDGTVTGDLESRLKDLFGDSGESPSSEGNSGGSGKAPIRELEEISAVAEDVDKKDNTTPEEPNDFHKSTDDKNNPDDSELRYLKSIVLSIDWEINDETMQGLIDETDRLKDVYEDDRTGVLLFQLLGSVGKYIKNNKAGAHPDSIKLLSSIYSGLETVMLSKGMIEAARKNELLAQLKKFKQLKEQIGPAKNGTIKKKKASSNIAQQEKIRPGGKTLQEVERSDVSHVLPHEAFAFALEEIKEVIKAEFRALRAELKLWKEGK